MADKKFNLLFGITGSIAASKCVKILQLLKNIPEIAIKIVPTANSLPFFSMEEISELIPSEYIYSLEQTGSEEYYMLHIKLAKWADAIIISPATANFVAKLANGIADDLLSTVCVASKARTFVAPAMNKNMWLSATNLRNIRRLAKLGTRILRPRHGQLACGDVGVGRLWEPDEIFKEISEYSKLRSMLAGKNVLITAGPTREPLDPVRFISNRSTGKMGYEIALACEEAGAKVVLVSGPVSLGSPKFINEERGKLILVETAQEMRKAVFKEIDDADVFVACAAVMDFRPSHFIKEKIKTENLFPPKNDIKNGISKTSFDPQQSEKSVSPKKTIEITKNPHILQELSSKHQNSEKLLVGFAAETDRLEENAKLKLERSDIVVANSVGEGKGFGQDHNEIKIFSKNLPCEEHKGEKRSLGRIIAQFIARYRK